MEGQRVQGVVKGSLEADIQVFASQSVYQSLLKLGPELRFVTITSKAELASLEEADADANSTSMDGLRVAVASSKANKCIRCWHFIDDVGASDQHPHICGRCIENISGDGEQRLYA